MVSRKNLPDIVKKLVEHVDMSENLAFKEVKSLMDFGCYRLYVIFMFWQSL